MKTRLALSLVPLAAAGVLVGAVSGEAPVVAASSEPAYCVELTPARLLEDPQVAGELYGAMSRGDPGARARFEAFVSDVREAHGCTALAGTVAREAVRAAPRLPPGHPPIPPQTPRTPQAPVFDDRARIVEI